VAFKNSYPTETSSLFWIREDTVTSSCLPTSDGVKPGSARLRLEPKFLLLLEKLEPKNQQSLIGSTEKNSGLKSLIF
jgi:hypothetical protein